jgi:hypothetical protein
MSKREEEYSSPYAPRGAARQNEKSQQIRYDFSREKQSKEEC